MLKFYSFYFIVPLCKYYKRVKRAWEILPTVMRIVMLIQLSSMTVNSICIAKIAKYQTVTQLRSVRRRSNITA
jgi:hypothetical protein